MERRNRQALVSAFQSAYQTGVRAYQEPAALGIRLHAFRITLDQVVAALTATNANFDAAKFRKEIGPYATPVA